MRIAKIFAVMAMVMLVVALSPVSATAGCTTTAAASPNGAATMVVGSATAASDRRKDKGDMEHLDMLLENDADPPPGTDVGAVENGQQSRDVNSRVTPHDEVATDGTGVVIKGVLGISSGPPSHLACV